MAKSEMVEVPADLLKQLQARLDTLEHTTRIQQEMLLNSKAKILDPDYEQWKADVSRSALVRSQEVADRKYGTQAPRFRCRLDSTTADGKPGPDIREHPELVLSAHSDLEAQARYLELVGIRKHDYAVRAEPVAA